MNRNGIYFIIGPYDRPILLNNLTNEVNFVIKQADFDQHIIMNTKGQSL